MAVHKKQQEEPIKAKAEEAKSEPVIVTDVITETIEVIEEVSPEIKKESTESTFAEDPLTDFKEKMIKEEYEMPNTSSKKNYMWPILLIFIIAIISMAGIFAYKQGIFKGIRVSLPSSTPTPAPTIIPEPTKTLDLTQYEVEILNGGGVSGEASRQKAELEAAGFTISSVGNADNSDFTDTIIQAKAEVNTEFIAKLKATLNNSFTVGQTETLVETSSVPVVVTLGTKK